MSKLQGADLKTEAELVTAGADKTYLPRDTQIYVTANAINKTLDDAIIDGDIAGGASGIKPNFIINGDFDFWQRGVSQTTSGFGSDDRWFNQNIGATKTASRQDYDFSGGFAARYFSRTVVSSVVGVNNGCLKFTRLEDLRSYSGKTMTLSYWFKSSNAALKLGIEIAQNFGTGGAPSATVRAVYADTLPSSNTTWTKYTHTFTVPSVSGKTFGTNNNDHLLVFFWFDAGSNQEASSSTTTGHQSGTFDIAQVKLEEGSVATPFVRAGLTLAQEFILCERYYYIVTQGQAGFRHAFGIKLNNDQVRFGMQHMTPMRTNTGTVIQSGTGAVGQYNAVAVVVDNTFTYSISSAKHENGTPLFAIAKTAAFGTLTNGNHISFAGNGAGGDLFAFDAEL